MPFNWNVLQLDIDEEFFTLAEFAHERNFKVLRFAALWLSWAAAETSFLADNSTTFRSHRFAWRQTAQRWPLFQYASLSRGPPIIVPCVTDNVKFIIFTFFELRIVLLVCNKNQ